MASSQEAGGGTAPISIPSPSPVPTRAAADLNSSMTSLNSTSSLPGGANTPTLRRRLGRSQGVSVSLASSFVSRGMFEAVGEGGRTDGTGALQQLDLSLDSHFDEELANGVAAEAAPLLVNAQTEYDTLEGEERGGPEKTPRRRRLDTRKLLLAVLYGIINSVIVLPVMISYASIIFRHPIFHKTAMPYLVKLILLSSSVHQTVFTLRSSMRFAIGQVQDAGLIFLSSMATSIVEQLQAQDPQPPYDEIIATVLCWLAMSTALLGIALMITGWLKLAGVVQYLPMPVIGGYLAFIGFYCLQAALSLMSGLNITSVVDWREFSDTNAVLLCLPGVTLGLLLTVLMVKVRHFAVLPCFLLAIPIGFYLVLLSLGVTVGESASSLGHGWVDATDGSANFWEVWENFRFDRVHWDVLPRQVPTWIAMYLVVAFSSSLDVAAIQMELGRTLNFNDELKMIGLSNFVSGITGGFTGSYIFSQTIFTMRTGLETRLIGACVAVSGFCFFMVPISILNYLPRFFFGTVLTFIALDLLISWLWHARKLVHVVEFVLIWCTFIAINALDLEFGMLVGVGLAMFLFLLEYSRVRNCEPVNSVSNVVRNPEEHRLLCDLERYKITALRLSGYIFFGSAVGVVKEVAAALEASASPQQLANGRQIYLVLDFRDVSGIDATAVRSCFIRLKQLMQERSAIMVLTSLRPAIRRLLRNHGVIPSAGEGSDTDVRCFDSFDEGLAWAEDDVVGQDAPLTSLVAATQPPEKMDFEQILFAHFRGPAPVGADLADIGTGRYMELLTYSMGDVIFRAGDASNAVYFLSAGQVGLCCKRAERSEPVAISEAVVQAAQRGLEAVRRCTGLRGRRYRGGETEHDGRQAHERQLLTCRQGSIFGDTGFYLGQPRRITAVCTSPVRVYRITRNQLESLRRQHPAFVVCLEAAIMQSLCRTLQVHFVGGKN